VPAIAGKELRALLKALGAARGVADLMSDAGLVAAEGAGILAEQATLLMTSIAMPAWCSHSGIREQEEESGAEKAEDMREEGRGR
jgi:hypothetical protein